MSDCSDSARGKAESIRLSKVQYYRICIYSFLSHVGVGNVLMQGKYTETHVVCFKSCIVLSVFSWDLTMPLPLYPQLAMLKSIRALDPDRCAIVRWNGWFQDRRHVCLEFELLHMSLRDFLRENEALTMDEIRTVLNQVCCASSSRILHFVLQEQ